MVTDLDMREAGAAAPFREEPGLLLGPAVAGVAGCPGFDPTLDSEEASRRTEHPAGFPETRIEVLPVVHGRQ
jgi:hypothetical protein